MYLRRRARVFASLFTRGGGEGGAERRNFNRRNFNHAIPKLSGRPRGNPAGPKLGGGRGSVGSEEKELPRVAVMKRFRSHLTSSRGGPVLRDPPKLASRREAEEEGISRIPLNIARPSN